MTTKIASKSKGDLGISTMKSKLTDSHFLSRIGKGWSKPART